MEQNVVTLILPVKAGEENILEGIFAPMWKDPETNPTVPFRDIRSIHFARLVLIKSEKGGEVRLLFSACHDGGMDALAADLQEAAGAGLDQIFSHCSGYVPGTWQEAERAVEFVRSHHLPPNASVVAFRGVSAATILNAAEARKTFEDLADTPELRRMVESFCDRPLQTEEIPDSSGSPALSKLADRVIELFLGKVGDEEDIEILQTKPPLAEAEDRIAQNQMTIVSPNQPGIWRFTLKAILWAANLNANRGGSLGSLPTIHFAQWTMIDGGENLLFLSNYNGSWENYIDDFIDYAHTGLDAIWGHCPAFPTGGCRNVEGFKNVIRRFQHPAQVYYSAYPARTVAHIAEDLKLADEMKAALNGSGIARVLTGSHPPLPDWINQ